MKAVHFLAMLGLTGCAALVRPTNTSLAVSQAVVFHGDTEFSPQERSAVEKAMDTWEAQTGGLIQPTVVWDLDFQSVSSLAEHKNDHLIVRWTRGLVVEQYGESEANLLGYSPGSVTPGSPDGPAHVMLVADTMSELDKLVPGAFVTVSMHELGHVFGLRHLGPEAVMKSGYNGGKACLSQEDLTEFCRTRTCGSTRLFPCERWSK